VGWKQSAGLLFGDWGTSRLYVLGLAFAFAGGVSLYLIIAMSVLILLVGWAYTQICRIYPDGGGVYTAAKQTSRLLAVIGALLLFADYVVTASLSSLDAFHYFGLPAHVHAVPLPGIEHLTIPDSMNGRVWFDATAGVIYASGHLSEMDRSSLLSFSRMPIYQQAINKLFDLSSGTMLFAWDSPGLWAMIAIVLIGLFNLMGPKHTGAFAIAAAGAMVGITLLIAFGALPKVDWKNLSHHIGPITEGPRMMWMHFVGIVLALSGVEAIGNLTGVMKAPVATTARKAIWIVAVEVAVFNILLAVCMVSQLTSDQQDAHKEDMLAFLASSYIGPWAEWSVRIVGGLLLLSAVNTVITDMISVQYLLSRDGELPQSLQKLNRFGVPVVPALIATLVPVGVLVISHDLESLAALYAIGVVGAVAINITLVSFHPRLRARWRKLMALAIGALLVGIWVTLAFTKLHALLFVVVVLLVGLTARAITKIISAARPKPSLLRQAIVEQLPEEVVAGKKMLLGTYGSIGLMDAALDQCSRDGAALVVCFIRQVSLSYKYDEQMTLDTDPVAVRTFARFLDAGHEKSVPVIPVYDSGRDAAELIAENAAIHGCEKVIIGTSRQGALYHLVKGHFQRRLESLLPASIPVEVINAEQILPPKRLALA
jgi:amino acid transporter